MSEKINLKDLPIKCRVLLTASSVAQDFSLVHDLCGMGVERGRERWQL
jgi:hypothetical protein